MATGTTSPIFIQRDSSPKTVKPGEGYFLVQVHGAQAAFSGAVWHSVKGLVVTSQVNLNGSPQISGEMMW